MAHCLIPEARLRSNAMKGFSVASLIADRDCYLFSVSTEAQGGAGGSLRMYWKERGFGCSRFSALWS